MQIIAAAAQPGQAVMQRFEGAGARFANDERLCDQFLPADALAAGPVMVAGNDQTHFVFHQTLRAYPRMVAAGPDHAQF